MQHAFSFMLDTEPTQSAIDEAVSQAQTAILEEPDACVQASVPPEPVAPKKRARRVNSVPDKDGLNLATVPSNTVNTKGLDLTKTVIMTRSKDGFKLTPLSRAAGTKLMLAERRFQGGKNKLNKIFSDAVISNIGRPVDQYHPIANLMGQYGLDLIVSSQAKVSLTRLERDFKRMMVPFKFHVPVQFKDLQGKDDDFVTGPFVTDVYSEEIKKYTKRLADLGLTNMSADFHLHQYQADDVCQLACKYFAFINHDMGLGKTLIAAALMQMHGYERILVIAPAACIGSFSSGWRHELRRMGIPEDHIHVIEGPEDLPQDADGKRSETFRPFIDKPHVYLVDYTTLSKEKIDKNVWPNRRVATGGRINRARLMMSHILKRRAYGKTKYLTDVEHAAVDNLTTEEMRKQVANHSDTTALYRIDGYLSPKPVWKHIHKGMFKFLLMDESHMVKDNSTRRGKAIHMIRGLKRVYIMTGTMLTNYVSDSFWQLQRLFPGGLYPVGRQMLDFSAHKGKKLGEKNFLGRFEGKKKYNPTGIVKPEDFWGLMARVQLRRHDDDAEVNAQAKLPEIVFNTEFVEMDPYHRDIYRMKTGDFQKDVREKIKGSRGAEFASKLKVEDLAPLNPADLRTKLQDLRQIAACPDQSGIYSNKNGSIKMTTKDARILELIMQATAKSEKTVVFCSWKAQIERMKFFLKDQGIATMILNGSNTKWEKWAGIDRWRSTLDEMVMLASIDAMGTAVNLTSFIPEDFKCRQVIFSSPEWSPVKMGQAWKRVHRIGQTEETHVHFLYHKDTIEEEMDNMLYQKRENIAKAQDRVEITRDDNQSIITYQEIASRIINRYNQEAA